jgi:hypothetical protein
MAWIGAGLWLVTFAHQPASYSAIHSYIRDGIPAFLASYDAQNGRPYLWESSSTVPL